MREHVQARVELSCGAYVLQNIQSLELYCQLYSDSLQICGSVVCPRLFCLGCGGHIEDHNYWHVVAPCWPLIGDRVAVNHGGREGAGHEEIVRSCIVAQRHGAQ